MPSSDKKTIISLQINKETGEVTLTGDGPQFDEIAGELFSQQTLDELPTQPIDDTELLMRLDAVAHSPLGQMLAGFVGNLVDDSNYPELEAGYLEALKNDPTGQKPLINLDKKYPSDQDPS